MGQLFTLPFFCSIIAFIMSEIANQSLNKIAKGAVLTFMGTGIGMVLVFISRLMVARYVTQSDYGIYSLALVVMNIFTLISVLGLDVGSARQIALYRGKGDGSKVRGVVFSSLLIAVTLSSFLSVVLFFISDLISMRLFNNPELATILRIFSITIPLFNLISILAAIFRGFERAEPSAYFQNILKNLLFTLFLAGVIFLNLQFSGVVWAYVVSMMVTFIAFAVYAIKRSPVALQEEKKVPVSSMTKELLLFSLPLFGMTISGTLMTFVDTLMLGFFTTSADVGLYNAASPLAQILTMGLYATSFLCIPLMTQLHSKHQNDEIKRSYAVLSKWTFAATLPVFLIFFLFPGATINIVFGSGYVAAATALQILSAGYFVFALFGLNTATLIAMGETHFSMWSIIISMIVNIVLNMVLIPVLGIVGAAIATSVSFVVRSILFSTKLYLVSRAHLFTKNYLKPAIASVVLVLIIYVLIKNLVTIMPFWLLLVLLAVFWGTYALSILLTRSFDKEDIAILLGIERILGLNLARLKKILKMFL